MRDYMSEEERKRYNKQKAASIVAASGLKIVTGVDGKPKLVDDKFKEEEKSEELFSGFKPSLETQPSAAPFTFKDLNKLKDY